MQSKYYIERWSLPTVDKLLVCPPATNDPDLSKFAEHYVRLSLACSYTDPLSLDMYFGPEEWKEEMNRAMANDTRGLSFSVETQNDKECSSKKKVFIALRKRCAELLGNLYNVHAETEDVKYRLEFILANARALFARQRHLCGEKFSFIQQAQEFYDVEVEESFPLKEVTEETLAELDKLLPDNLSADVGHYDVIIKPAKNNNNDGVKVESISRGNISDNSQLLASRFDSFRAQFVIPKNQYKKVFEFALAECRSRCKEQLTLMPVNEKCDVVWFDDQQASWEAFEGFKRNGRSEIKVNLARLITLNKAEWLPANEGYPGHHYMFGMMEQELVKKRNWVEFSVVNKFSPYSTIAEGGAEWAAHRLLWWNLDERSEYLHRLAKKANMKFDTALLRKWCVVASLTDPSDQVGRVHVHIASQLIDGQISKQEAQNLMFENGFRADASWPNVTFLQEFGAYIINYSYGKHLVNRWIEARVKKNDVSNWKAFEDFVQRPPLPHNMKLQE